MSKTFKTIGATAVSFAASSIIGTAVAATAALAADSTKLLTGLTPIAPLLQLIDTEKSGKIARDDFSRFMQGEFDFADMKRGARH
jgi:hypothetical protein